ncbi:FAD-binding oxidoreductase [Aquaspirillum serpens]|uniref:FAD-binding oxidoreductase n=1 Tax=Aquaspirillum serpens TaxID=190 RepID=UPI0003B6206A|nr:FAD-binding oxidoreductase [Aquaspirillum serpens]
MDTAPILSRLRQIVGHECVYTDATATAPFVIDWRKRFHGQALAVVLPSTTAEVAEVVRCCQQYGVQLVPQGGNTGLVGGGVPDASGRTVVLSLRRLRQIRHIDANNNTMTVEAGLTLAELHQHAQTIERLFPLSLASEGSCTIGGNIATNAGGTAVLRYGNMRELTLGLEVVLANGEVLSELKGLRKNNSGYDLKQLFIGSEGTLGIITAATVRLFPLPTAYCTAMIEVASPDVALAWLHALQARFDDRLTTFELISGRCLQLVQTHISGARVPFHAPWAVLFELSDGGEDAHLEQQLLEWLPSAPRYGEAVIAQNRKERQALWLVREAISEAQSCEGISLKHDIAVPVSAVPMFLQQAGDKLRAAFPDCRITAFGHLGDGNLHYNVSQTGAADIYQDEPRVNRIVFETAYQLGGTLSAEHGIGRLRRETLWQYRSPLARQVMQQLKQGLDPAGLFNPGVLFPAQEKDS